MPDRIYEPVSGGVLEVPSLYARNQLIKWLYPGMLVKVLETPEAAPFGDAGANPTGRTYRLRPLDQCVFSVTTDYGRDDQHWELVDSGEGGDDTYGNPGTGTTVGGLPAGTVIPEGTPQRTVFDMMLRAVFNANVQITNISGTGVVAHAGQWIFEKGTVASDITVTGTITISAGTVNSRAVLANNVQIGAPLNNAISIDDPGLGDPAGRRVATAYLATMNYTTNLGAPGARTSAPATLTPYAPSYYRVVTSATPSQATMKAGTKVLWGPTAQRSAIFSANASANERAALSVPLALGGVKKITDEGGALTYYDANTSAGSNAFQRTLESYTLLDGTLEPMEVFALKNPAGNGSPFTYKIFF